MTASPRFLPGSDGRWPAWLGWAARLGLSGLLPWLAWRQLGLGPVSLVLMAPLLGALWARVLLDAASALWRRTRELSIDRLPGQTYGFRGRAVRIQQDAYGRHWVPGQEVRRAGVALPADTVLAARLRPGHWAPATDARDGLLLRVDALADDLVHASEARTVRFGRWLRSEVLRQRPG